MAITAANYEKARALANQPGVSEAVRARLMQELSAYEDDYQGRAQKAMPQPEPITSVGTPVPQLDPSFSLVPQALAVQPATTHPVSDKAAEEEWVRSGGAGANGTVIVYDMPAAEVRKRLLESPELVGALGYRDFVPSAQSILELDEKSSLFQAAQDHFWRETADAAAKGGKTAYRQSKAPWLSGGGDGWLSNLQLKATSSLAPAVEGAVAFVMGVDDTAAFGLGRQAGETLDAKLHPEGQGPAPEGTSGGIASVEGASPTEVNDMINEEHPTAHAAGQVLGVAPGLVTKGAAKLAGLASETAEQGIRALRPWSASNALFDTIADAATWVGSKLGAPTAGLAGAAGKVATGAAAGAAAGAAHQGVSEAVDAAGSYARTGEPGTTFDEAAERTLEAGRLGGKFGALGGAVEAGAGAVGNWTRTGARYEKAPQRLERAGVKFEVGKGPVPPKDYRAAVAKADELDTTVEDVIAKDLEPTMNKGARAVHADAKKAVSAEKKAFYPTAEGQAEIPVTNLVTKGAEILRRQFSKRGGKAFDEVGVPGAGGGVKRVFNKNIERVSLEPVDGAVELTAKEADAFLTPEHRRALLSKPGKGAKPQGSSGAREIDLEGGETGADDLAADAVQKSGAKKVYVVPRRYNAEHTDQAITNVGQRGQAVKDKPADRDMEALRDALYEDRGARSMNGRPGGWSETRASQQERLAKARDTRDRVVPRSTETGPRTGSHTTLTQYARQHSGELPTVEALREVAGRQGVSERLEQLRIAQPLDDIQRRIGFGKSDNARMPGVPNPGKGSISGRLFDAAHLRLAYPVLRQLEGPLGPLGRGAAARAGAIGDEKGDERRAARDAPSVPKYTERRTEAMDPKKKRAKKKRKKR